MRHFWLREIASLSAQISDNAVYLNLRALNSGFASIFPLCVGLTSGSCAELVNEVEAGWFRIRGAGRHQLHPRGLLPRYPLHER